MLIIETNAPQPWRSAVSDDCDFLTDDLRSLAVSGVSDGHALV
jgi:hypothetical protein